MFHCFVLNDTIRNEMTRSVNKLNRLLSTYEYLSNKPNRKLRKKNKIQKIDRTGHHFCEGKFTSQIFFVLLSRFFGLL